MKSVNKVILIGHLGKDPEVKYTQGGMPVAKFTLATNDRQKDKDGQWQDHTEWHNIVAFQRTAEVVAQYLKKGRQVYIEGTLRTGSWEDKETGKKMYKTDILVNDLVLLGGGRGESGGGEQAGSSRGVAASNSGGNNFDQSAPEAEHAPAGSSPITDEDIPF